MEMDKKYNFGLLNGWLKAIARFNDKSNYGYEFELDVYPKDAPLVSIIERLFGQLAENYKIKTIRRPKNHISRKLYDYWFYEFQRKRPTDVYYLEDNGKDFSLSYDDDKWEWVEEFVDLLLATTEFEKVYEIKLGPLRNVYGNAFNDFILEAKNEVYHLHLLVSD